MRPRTPPPRLTLAEAMAALEAAGSEQTRKTYVRHGVPAPMFGVSFAVLKTLVKRIRVDHTLAIELWATGNHDARMLAVKVADPDRMGEDELDAWAGVSMGRGCGGYVAMLTAEGPHAVARAEAWLASPNEVVRSTGWALVGELAMTSPAVADGWFVERVGEIEAGVQAAPNAVREAMMGALITIGCRSQALRELAIAAAGRIGPVVIDHGDTDCKTPQVGDSLAKAWAHSTSKGFPSPAKQEQARESRRTRC